MNRTYKVIWSKARHCYVVVSELTKSQHKSSSKSELISTNVHRGGVLGKAAVAAIVAGLLTFGGVAYSPVLADTAKNPAGSGSGVAIGTGSNAPKEENVAIGKEAVISYSNGASNATGDIVVGNGANINNYASQGGSIAIGKNAKVENMAGGGEASFAFGQTTFSGTAFSKSRIPADPSKVIGSIAIGDNTFARTGSTMIGSHNYKGELGDTTVDSTSTRTYALNVYATTVGANSFSNGAFTTNTGSYNIISSEYDGGRLANPVKNMGATITGALNSIESIGAGYYSGIANTVSGIANRTSNSNGTLIYGAGNEVMNSITSLTGTPRDSGNSAKEFSEKLRDTIKASNSGGATLVIGGANVADYTQKTQIIGVNNKVTGTSDRISDYNMINGYGITVTSASHLYTIGANNTITNAKNTILFGDNRKAEGVENSVIIGNADKTAPITTEKKDTVIVGHNANATIDGGVAIGSDSIANVEKGQKGYYVKHDQRSEEGQGYPFKNNDSAWISRAGAVSVGDTTNEDQSKWITRQITGVAAGTNDTDAVNVAQLKNSQTRFYSIYDPGDNWLGIFPQIPNWEKYKNEDNQGAQGYWSMAAGFGTSTGGIASTVIGSLSKIDNKWTDGKPNGFQGATAVSVGTLNFNLSDQVTEKEVSSDDPRVIFQSKEESGVANSIVGQGNLTKNSNGALIYGAGNIVTDSYRRVVANGDKDFESLINQDMESLLSDPEKAIKTLGKIVDISGGKVMAIGGGNVVDKAYDSQVMGVGNTVVGDAINFEYKESPEVSNLPEGTFDEQVIKEASRDADVWTQYMGSIRKQGTLLNLVDGYYSTLKNGQNDYLIGTANEVTGDPSKNKSNIVFGDYHKLNNGNNNIIIGSADGAVVEKAKGYFEDDESGITTSQEITGQKQHTENLEDAVMIGHNADVQKNGGVAIGAGSVAVMDKDAVGYDPANGDHQTDTTGTWKSTAAAVSVGDASKNITRQITNLAAGAQDTDAVNVAQLKAAQTHFYSVNSTDEKAGNYNNDGAKGTNSLAAGVGALANGSNSVAIGTNAKAQNDALAVGESASAGNNSIAIGMNASAGYSQNMALGYYANVAKGVTNSTALGYGSQVTKRDILKSDGNDGVISVGKSVGQSGEKGMTRRIINVKAGVNDTDAVNVSQLKQQAQAATTEVMVGTNIASVTKNDKTSDGHTIYTVNAKGTTMSGDNNFTITATPNDATNVTDYKISLKNTIIIGSGAESSGAETHPITINGTDGVISGLINTTWDKNHDYSQSTKAATEAQLQNAMKDAQKAAEANDTDTHVKAGEYAVDTKHQVSMDIVDKEGKSTGNKITITDVAKASDVGDVKKLDADIQNADGKTTVVDAVNHVDNKVGNLDYSSTKYVAKGEDVTTSIGKLDEAIKNASEAAGKHTIVSPKDANISVENIAKEGEAANYQISLNKDLNVDSVTATNKITTKDLEVTGFAAIGKVTINKDNKGTIGGLTNKTWDAKNITSGQAATEDQLQAATKNAVNYDGDDSKTVTLREDTTIQNVANTTIEEGSKNAVNAGTVYNETRVAKDGNFVKQSNTAGENLSALDNQVTANTESIYHMNGRISDLDNRVNKVGAGAAALAALHPLDFDPDDKWDFAVGYGNYRNANSVALGAFYRPNEDTMFSLGTNFGNGENMFNAGLSFKIGQGGSGITTSKTAMAKKIESLENTVDQQDKKIAELEALVKEQGEMIRQYVGKK